MTNILILSYFFGIVIAISSLAVIIRPEKLGGLLRTLRKTDGAFFGLGLVIFMLGLIIVSLHNDWGSFGGIAMGVYGWLAIVESLLYMFLPTRSLAHLFSGVNNPLILRVTGIVGLGLGISLLMFVLPAL